MQISPIKNQNFDQSEDFEEKIFLDISQKNLVPRMLSHHGNVRTSKFWRKSKEKKRNFFVKIYEGHIRI